MMKLGDLGLATYIGPRRRGSLLIISITGVSGRVLIIYKNPPSYTCNNAEYGVKQKIQLEFVNKNNYFGHSE